MRAQFPVVGPSIPASRPLHDTDDRLRFEHLQASHVPRTVFVRAASCGYLTACEKCAYVPARTAPAKSEKVDALSCLPNSSLPERRRGVRDRARWFGVHAVRDRRRVYGLKSRAANQAGPTCRASNRFAGVTPAPSRECFVPRG